MYCSNISKGKYYWPAIDLLILSGILGQSYEVDVLDALIERMSAEDCLERILAQDYKAVIFLTGSASWPQDLDFVSRIKAGKPGILLVGNGDILLYKAQEFLEQYPFLDAVLLDYTSSDILAFLDYDRSSLTAMAYREDGVIVVKHEPVQGAEFSYPIPHHEKFPLRKYLLVHGRRFPFTTVQASFGCPFKCSFCIAATLGYRYRSVDNVLEELHYVASLGIKDVFFTDFTFEVNRNNTLELCQRMVKDKLDLTWVCSSRASTLDEELINWMHNAGCHTLLLGVESGDEGLLENYSKGVTKDDLRQAFALCRRYGIRTVGHFIIGLPGETEETAQKTIAFAKELNCDIASFNIAIPAPGTKLREIGYCRRLSQGRWHAVRRHRFLSGHGNGPILARTSLDVAQTRREGILLPSLLYLEDGYHGTLLVPVEAVGFEWISAGATGLFEALESLLANSYSFNQ